MFRFLLVSILCSGFCVAEASESVKPIRLTDNCLSEIKMISIEDDRTEKPFAESSNNDKAFLLKAEEAARSVAKMLLADRSVNVSMKDVPYVRSFVLNAHDDWYGAKVVLGESQVEVEDQSNFIEVLFLADDSTLSGATGLRPLTAVIHQHMGEEPEFILCAK